MSIDKELIKMCDCPEIQDKWEPKVGDEVASGIIITTFYKLKRDSKKLMVRDSNHQLTRCEQSELIYIPRIEDVLEWLGDRFESLRRIRQTTRQVGHSHGSLFHKSTGNYDDFKALIKAYMHLEHNKTWDGAAWK